jgi:hypothetical protein
MRFFGLLCVLMTSVISCAGDDGDDEGGGGTGAASGSSACPNVLGVYEVSISGDCETLNVDAAQSIEATATECHVEFVSDEPDPGAKAVSGEATLDADGNFADARLFLDSVLRFPCDGTWSAADESMTVVCEGLADPCTSVLNRL